MFNDIEKVKERIINNALLIGSLLGLITFLVSLTSSFSKGFSINNIIDLVVVLVLIGITVKRKKIALIIKSLVIIMGLLVLIVTDVYKWGLYSDNIILVIIIPFFTFLVLNFRKTIIIYAVSILLIAGIAYLQLGGKIPISPAYIDRIFSLNAWIIKILLITLISFLIVVVVKQFNIAFTNLISSLKEKNIELSQKEQSYRDIFNTSSDAIFIHDFDGNILDVNSAMLKMYGFTKEEVIERDLNSFISGKGEYTIEKAFDYFKKAIADGKVVFDWQAKNKKGTFFWVEVALKKTHILNEPRVLAVIRNIDEKKKAQIQLKEYKVKLEEQVQERTRKLEETNEDLLATNEELHTQSLQLQQALKKLETTQEQLVQSEKMASLGTLSAGVAHEINNPLNFIKGGLLGLETYFEQDNKVKNEEVNVMLNAINEGIERAASIVRSLNRLSRKDETEKEPCNIHNILNNCLTVLHGNSKKNIEIIKDYYCEDIIINGIDSKLHKAFLNVIINAEQAIKNSGSISIKSKILNKNIYIYIIDNGIGISKQNISKITEPFYTTKDPGQGTGLGLSMTYNIISEHNGILAFESEPNEGTKVTIKIPIE